MRSGPGDAGDLLIFSINTQDFSRPDHSAATLTRILDLHEQHQVPVDVYLTDTQLDLFQTRHPDLLARLGTSTVVRLNYHVRPPKPYYADYDWAGLSRQSASQQVETVTRYEQQVTDGVTGQPSGRSGGYAALRQLATARPGIASFNNEGTLLESMSQAFRSLGASWTVTHMLPANLGEQRNGLHLRPEHHDLKLFEHPGESVPALMEQAFASAHALAGARAPYVVGVKMHDNDFFAQRSAWLTVYLEGGRRQPNWDTSLTAPLKTEAEMAQQWALYEAALAWAVANRSRVGVANSGALDSLRQPGTPRLHLSGTMHIESRRDLWPNVDALIAFFQRAVACGRVGSQTSGMRWSIGADIGWLTGEARAGEVVRTLSALGVQWDVHAHEHADRIRCAEQLRALGATPTGVVSGLVNTEIDALRAPLSGSTGSPWQASALWGVVLDDGHRLGSDDRSAGLWRPRSGSDWLSHDPAGNLAVVGGGARTLAGAEALATAVAGGTHVQPVYSATLNVGPQTLAVVGTTDGIAQIEAWAARVGAMAAVRWSTLQETATAWLAAGALPSRVNP
ncbi:MAG: hypothetical protein JNM08_08215 [Rubrivivax sp.]|nr:hypothetical protein [Rubrivivax sp.]